MKKLRTGYCIAPATEMSLLRYFKSANRLPTADEAGLPTTVTAEVNKAVEKALHGASKVEKSKKRKYTTAFTPEDRAAIGRYAAENGNAKAVKKFKATHDVGESTVRLFKKSTWKSSRNTFQVPSLRR